MHDLRLFDWYEHTDRMPGGHLSPRDAARFIPKIDEILTTFEAMGVPFSLRIDTDDATRPQFPLQCGLVLSLDDTALTLFRVLGGQCLSESSHA